MSSVPPKSERSSGLAVKRSMSGSPSAHDGAQHLAGVVGPLVGVGEGGGGEQAQEDEGRPDPLEGRRDDRRSGADAVAVGVPEAAVDPGRGAAPTVPPENVPPVPVRAGEARRCPSCRRWRSWTRLRASTSGGGARRPSCRCCRPRRTGRPSSSPARWPGRGSAAGRWAAPRGVATSTDAGRSEANLLTGESSVLRSMVILRPSRVRLADGPVTLSVGVGDRQRRCRAG